MTVWSMVTKRDCHFFNSPMRPVAKPENCSCFSGLKLKACSNMPVPVISVAQMREWEKASWAAGRTADDVIDKVGQAIARRLAADGAAVVISDWRLWSSQAGEFCSSPARVIMETMSGLHASISDWSAARF